MVIYSKFDIKKKRNVEKMLEVCIWQDTEKKENWTLDHWNISQQIYVFACLIIIDHGESEKIICNEVLIKRFLGKFEIKSFVS